MISFESKGDFSKLNSFFERTLELADLGFLDKYGREGVMALSAATPVYTGLAASSWYYTIERNKNSVSLIWSNSDIENGRNVILLIQYGHATKSGTYVAGRDFINPALKPIFDRIADEAWKGVNNL